MRLFSWFRRRPSAQDGKHATKLQTKSYSSSHQPSEFSDSLDHSPKAAVVTAALSAEVLRTSLTAEDDGSEDSKSSDRIDDSEAETAEPAGTSVVSESRDVKQPASHGRPVSSEVDDLVISEDWYRPLEQLQREIAEMKVNAS